MIRFEPAPEPTDFDEKVRKPGNAWLAKNPAPKRPEDYWRRVAPELATAFQNLCAYTALYTIPGVFDHYRSCKNHRELAYEWSNYRYAMEKVNNVKGTADDNVLDPFEIGEDWFEILLPSLQLVVTDAIPPEHRERAVFTLNRLGLLGGKADEWIIRARRSWYEMYELGELSLQGLERKAPLIARAVRKQLANSPDF